MTLVACCIAGLLLLPVFVIAAMGEAFGEGVDPKAAEGPTVDAEPAGSDDADPVPAGELEAKVLSHPRIKLSAGARRDVEMGRADRRILHMLLILAERHHLGYVGPIATGHSYFVRGTTRVSKHVHGRAVDISVIDGYKVDASNQGAYDAARTAAALEPPLQPSELGAPWKVPARPGTYSWTDGSHKDHLHIAVGAK